MAKTYRPYLPEQDLLLPPSLRDWLPEDHLAYLISDLVDQLDLSAITAVYEDEGRGYPPYHPVMLTKVLVYAYCVGVFSSRKSQRRLIEDVPFRVLAAGNEPDFRTIADFRKRHLAALRGFFEQVLRLARELGAPRVGRVALDSSKVKANASKHKAMSYGRMQEKQRQLREEVKQLLDKAEAADAAEDAEYGLDRRGDELPAELQRRESRLKRISRSQTGAGGPRQGRRRRRWTTCRLLLADAGYCSDESLTAIADTTLDAYISTRKQKHGERPGPCPRGPVPKTATIVDRMSRKLLTKTGAAVYAARKGMVEPVIGQIKQARGFRQFLLRGVENVQGEWSLVCATHNIFKLYRLCV